MHVEIRGQSWAIVKYRPLAFWYCGMPGKLVCKLLRIYLSPQTLNRSTRNLAHANKSGFTWVQGVKLRFPIMHWSTLPLNHLQNTSLFLHFGHKLLSLSLLNFLYIIKFWDSIKDLFIHVMNMSKLLLSSDTVEVGHRCFLCSMWLLETALRTSVRAASILSWWAISSAPWFSFELGSQSVTFTVLETAILARLCQMINVTIRPRLSEKHTLLISALLSCYNWTQGFHSLVI
jgi:hypothetical protein